MNVGEWFLWPELRQSSPTRKAKPSYKSPVSSINCCSIFRGWSSGALVKENNAERCAKGFGCWTQLVSMLFCQLAHADSLREICNGLGCCLGQTGSSRHNQGSQ